MGGNWERLVWNQRDALMAGLGVTLEVCAYAFAGAIVGGLVLCLARLYVPLLRPLAIVLIEFFRGTPIFVQLVWVNYVWPEVFGWPTSFLQAACMALALQSSGYLAETFRAGIEGVPRGHREAAMAVGMSRLQIFWRIITPQMLIAAAPALINQFTVIVKSSTLVSVITVPDLMAEALRIVNRTYEPIEILTATAVIYIGFIFAVSSLANMAAMRLRRRLGLAD